MTTSQKNIRYNFLHIPKTAGSTFRENIKNSKLTYPINMGHEVSYEPNSLNITFIRNPIDRTISHYSEIRNNDTKEIKFTDWFREKYWNFQTKWLLDKILKTDNLTNETFESLRKIIKSFYFIGVTENLDKDLKTLFKKMKIKQTIEKTNVTKKRYLPSQEEINLIVSKSSYDFKLYNFIKNGYS